MTLSLGICKLARSCFSVHSLCHFFHFKRRFIPRKSPFRKTQKRPCAPYSCNTSTIAKLLAQTVPKPHQMQLMRITPAVVNTTHTRPRLRSWCPNGWQGGENNGLAVDIGCEAFCLLKNQEWLRFSGWLVGHRNFCKNSDL